VAQVAWSFGNNLVGVRTYLGIKMNAFARLSRKFL
jgi:hypothetical protein